MDAASDLNSSESKPDAAVLDTLERKRRISRLPRIIIKPSEVSSGCTGSSQNRDNLQAESQRSSRQGGIRHIRSNIPKPTSRKNQDTSRGVRRSASVKYPKAHNHRIQIVNITPEFAPPRSYLESKTVTKPIPSSLRHVYKRLNRDCLQEWFSIENYQPVPVNSYASKSETVVQPSEDTRSETSSTFIVYRTLEETEQEKNILDLTPIEFKESDHMSQVVTEDFKYKEGPDSGESEYSGVEPGYSPEEEICHRAPMTSFVTYCPNKGKSHKRVMSVQKPMYADSNYPQISRSRSPSIVIGTNNQPNTSTANSYVIPEWHRYKPFPKQPSEVKQRNKQYNRKDWSPCNQSSRNGSPIRQEQLVYNEYSVSSPSRKSNTSRPLNKLSSYKQRPRTCTNDVDVPPNPIIKKNKSPQRSNDNTGANLLPPMRIYDCAEAVDSNFAMDGENSNQIQETTKEKGTKSWLLVMTNGSVTDFRPLNPEQPLPVNSAVSVKSKNASTLTVHEERVIKVTKKASSGGLAISMELNKNQGLGGAKVKERSDVFIEDGKVTTNVGTDVGRSFAKGLTTGMSKNYQYPSYGSVLRHSRRHETCNHTVESYVDCPSEVLQRTTNLETAVFNTCPYNESCSPSLTEHSHSPISDNTTTDYNDKETSYCTFNSGKKCDLFSSQSFNSCKPQVSKTKLAQSIWDYKFCGHNIGGEDILVNWKKGSISRRRNKIRGRKASPVSPRNFSLRSRRRRSGYRERSPLHASGVYKKNYHKYDTKYRVNAVFFRPQFFKICRLCRHRMNTVWRRATNRMGILHNRRSIQLSRFEQLSFIHNNLLKEDADVQTQMITFTDTGISAKRSQRSIAIVTSQRIGSWLSIYNKGMCGTSYAFQPLKIPTNTVQLQANTNQNRGPSIFRIPFCDNSNQCFIMPRGTMAKGQSWPSKCHYNNYELTSTTLGPNAKLKTPSFRLSGASNKQPTPPPSIASKIPNPSFGIHSPTNLPAYQTSLKPSSIFQAPVKGSSVTQTPVALSPQNQSPYTRSPINLSPITKSPINTSPVNRSPLNHSPVNRSPTNHSPIFTSGVLSPTTRTPALSVSPICHTPIRTPARSPQRVASRTPAGSPERIASLMLASSQRVVSRSPALSPQRVSSHNVNTTAGKKYSAFPITTETMNVSPHVSETATLIDCPYIVAPKNSKVTSTVFNTATTSAAAQISEEFQFIRESTSNSYSRSSSSKVFEDTSAMPQNYEYLGTAASLNQNNIANYNAYSTNSLVLTGDSKLKTIRSSVEMSSYSSEKMLTSNISLSKGLQTSAISMRRRQSIRATQTYTDDAGPTRSTSVMVSVNLNTPKKECAILTDRKEPKLNMTDVNLVSISSKEVPKKAGVAINTNQTIGFEESTTTEQWHGSGSNSVSWYSAKPKPSKSIGVITYYQYQLPGKILVTDRDVGCFDDNGYSREDSQVQYDLKDFSRLTTATTATFTSNTNLKETCTCCTIKKPSLLKKTTRTNQSVQYYKYPCQHGTQSTSTNVATASKGLSAILVSVPASASNQHCDKPQSTCDLVGFKSTAVTTETNCHSSFGQVTSHMPITLFEDSKRRSDAIVQYEIGDNLKKELWKNSMRRSSLARPDQSESLLKSKCKFGDVLEYPSSLSQYNDSKNSVNLRKSTNIGQSQLMSVFTLNLSCREIATQMSALVEQETMTGLMDAYSSHDLPRFSKNKSLNTAMSWFECIPHSISGLTHLDNDHNGSSMVDTITLDTTGVVPSKQSTDASSEAASQLNTLLLPKQLSSSTNDHHSCPSPCSRSSRQPCINFDKKLDLHLECLTRLMGSQNQTNLDSSSLTATNWVQREFPYPVASKEYQSLLDLEKATSNCLNWDLPEKPSDSRPITRKCSMHQLSCKPFPATPASITHDQAETSFSKDSLADVFPIEQNYSHKKEVLRSGTSARVNMVDKMTSDLINRKEVKENQLQATPENCDAATDSVPIEVKEHKSMGAFTSRIVLCPFQCKNSACTCEDCILLYDRPRCLVHHRSLIDASIQRLPSCRDVELEARREHAVDENENTDDMEIDSQELISQRVQRRVYKPPTAAVNIMAMSPCRSSTASDNSQAIIATEPLIIVPRRMHDPTTTNNCFMMQQTSTAAFVPRHRKNRETDASTSPSRAHGARRRARLSHIEAFTGCDHIDMKKNNCNNIRKRNLTIGHGGVSVQPVATETELMQKKSASASACEFPEPDVSDSNSGSPIESLTAGPRRGIVSRHRQLFDYPVDTPMTSKRLCLSKEHIAPKTTVRIKTVDLPQVVAEVVDTVCGSIEVCLRQQLKGRYELYSSTLKRHIGEVKENLTLQLTNKAMESGVFKKIHLASLPAMEARIVKSKSSATSRQATGKRTSCYVDTAYSAMDIRRDDNEKLRSVYCILSAIEGRIRRLRINMLN